MRSEWKIMSLSDLSIKTEYGFTASAKDTNENNEPKFLRITDIQRGIVNWNTVPYCEIESSKFNKYKLNYGDIVVARTGNSTGENYMFDSEELVVYASYLIRYVINQNIAEPKFIWYQMRTSQWINFINNVKGGSAQAGANAKTMGAYECFVPPLQIQKKIAHILSTLDDKIELNRKMNQTLEEMAQALFKSWFVDFDPVHAKAKCSTSAELQNAAKELGISKEILELFPSEFEESEMGMIPKGWNISSIEKEVNIYGGATPSTKEAKYWDSGENYWATPRDLSGLSSKILTATGRKITDEGVNKISSKQLPIGTILLSSRAPVGYIAYSTVPISINQGFIAMVCDKKLSNYFIMYWLDIAMNEIKNRAVGTTFAEISKSAFRSINLIVPSKKILAIFNQQTQHIVDRIVTNEHEISTLQKTRDTLLPKLLSGELDVSGIEIKEYLR